MPRVPRSSLIQPQTVQRSLVVRALAACSRGREHPALTVSSRARQIMIIRGGVVASQLRMECLGMIVPSLGAGTYGPDDTTV